MNHRLDMPPSAPYPPETDGLDVAALSARVRSLLESKHRVVIGVAGPPGVGKSTFTDRVISALADVPSVVVPFDGYHLASTELARLGRHDRKGAIDTFDLDGYCALLRRLCDDDPGTVYAPQFVREIEEPIAAAIPVSPEVRLILTEGNYLLVPESGIDRSFFDEVWYLELDDEVRVQRLIDRHVRYGKDSDAARRWVLNSDERNTVLIRRYRHTADTIVHVP